MKRQLVQIPAEQVTKLKELEKIRKDLAGYAISKKVHILLQEKLAEMFKDRIILEEHEHTKGEWVEYIRESMPVHIFAPIALGVIEYSKEMIGCPFTKILASNQGDKLWWGNYKQDIQDVGEHIIKTLEDKQQAGKYYADYKKFIESTVKLCESIRNSDISRLTKNQLLDNYAQFFEKVKKTYGLVWDVEAIEICLEHLIKKQLEELMKQPYKKSEFNANYSLITTPPVLSCINQEQIEIYEIALEISSGKKLSELFNYDSDIILKRLDSYPNIKSALKKLEKKYWWTSLGWTSREEKTMESFIADIKNILKENPDIAGELHRLKTFVEKTKKEKEKEKIKNIISDKKMSFYLDIFEHYAVMHDWRKEMQMKSTAVFNKFLFEISRRYHHKYNDIVWCWPEEIKKCVISGEINADEIESRKDALFVIITKDSHELFVGERAIALRKKELDIELGNIRDFKGIIASMGKVIGKAKVCFSSADAIQKMKKGDILVASMTQPDYVPAMKKASAIVTDEGGITCHAAIISRELKIPCIVGTRIATKVLKDNQLIEVNANHGAVKILED